MGVRGDKDCSVVSATTPSTPAQRAGRGTTHFLGSHREDPLSHRTKLSLLAGGRGALGQPHLFPGREVKTHNQEPHSTAAEPSTSQAEIWPATGRQVQGSRKGAGSQGTNRKMTGATSKALMGTRTIPPPRATSLYMVGQPACTHGGHGDV